MEAQLTLPLHACPRPELNGCSIQDLDLGRGTWGIGTLSWNATEGIWTCLANVQGSLCLVEVKVR